MEAIFNRNGHAVAWLKNGAVYNLSGDHRAYVHKGAVISYVAGYIGRVDQGHFKDRSHQCVAFLRGAFGGATLPIPCVNPALPALKLPPSHVIPPVPMARSIVTHRWSDLDWESYLAGQEPATY